MANAGGLAVVLIAALVGLGLVAGAVALLVYGIVARNARYGFRASLTALALATTAALLSTPFWIVVLTGRDTHGDPLNYGESSPIVAVVVVEALAIAGAVAGVARQAARRKSL